MKRVKLPRGWQEDERVQKLVHEARVSAYGLAKRDAEREVRQAILSALGLFADNEGKVTVNA